MARRCDNAVDGELTRIFPMSTAQARIPLIADFGPRDEKSADGRTAGSDRAGSIGRGTAFVEVLVKELRPATRPDDAPHRQSQALPT
jgi:hypothetical protein